MSMKARVERRIGAATSSSSPAAPRADEAKSINNRSLPMFNHVSIGVHDIARTKTFYDAALKPLGFTCLSEDAASLGYGDAAVALWIGQVAKPVSADERSNLHFCFDAGSCKAVDAFHAGALQAGGKDNGKPGLRKDYGDNYYAAFVIDPDGYRLEAYCSKPK